MNPENKEVGKTTKKYEKVAKARKKLQNLGKSKTI